jgi:hypothetical protein
MAGINPSSVKRKSAFIIGSEGLNQRRPKSKFCETDQSVARVGYTDPATAGFVSLERWNDQINDAKAFDVIGMTDGRARKGSAEI